MDERFDGVLADSARPRACLERRDSDSGTCVLSRSKRTMVKKENRMMRVTIPAWGCGSSSAWHPWDVSIEKPRTRAAFWT